MDDNLHISELDLNLVSKRECYYSFCEVTSTISDSSPSFQNINSDLHFLPQT